MELIFESQQIKDYLPEIPPVITFQTPLVQEQIKKITTQTSEPYIRAKLAFDFVRDEIKHSFDFESSQVSITAEDTLKNHEGICFAKAHLLASLLRGLRIPTGFCYQRVLKKPQNPNSGFALHGLNAVYLGHIGWCRVDPRGNKPGVHSEFSTIEEKLAYPIRTELGEIDYPNVWVAPLVTVLQSMEKSRSPKELFDLRPSSCE